MEVLRNFLVQEKTKQELVNELESTAGKKNVYTVVKRVDILHKMVHKSKIQAGYSRIKLRERCKWKSFRRK